MKQRNLKEFSVFFLIRKKNIDCYEERRIKRPFFKTFYFLFWKKAEGGCEMLESGFQTRLIQELKKRFNGCIVMKNDPSYIQGIPDLLVLYKNKWAALECKKNAAAKKRPNQEYYVDLMNRMSFSKFIYPENKEEVLHELQQSFES